MGPEQIVLSITNRFVRLLIRLTYAGREMLRALQDEYQSPWPKPGALC